MGVYIKGMEMPTAEQGIRTINIYADGVVTNYAEEAIGKAVPVPPHGRLGDLDELEKTFREDADAEWNRFACPVNWADAFDDVADMIADAPTIIPAEEGE